MGKQHETFPGESPNAGAKANTGNKVANCPECTRLPQDNPKIVPDEYPAENNPPKRRRIPASHS